MTMIEQPVAYAPRLAVWLSLTLAAATSLLNAETRATSAPLVPLPPPTRPDPGEFVGGVPLGGIGTGTFEVRGDGSFRAWQIFNNWGNTESVACWKHFPDYDLLNAFAAINVDGNAWVLERNPSQGLPGIAGVAYDGAFPFARLKYQLPEGTPLQVSMEAFGSFVPHHADQSGLPAAGLKWRLKNTSDKPVHVSLLLSVVNPMGVTCQEQSVGKLTVVESTDGQDGVAVAALDSEGRSVTGGDDTPRSLQALWSAFAAAEPKYPSTGKGQRVARIISFSLQPNQETSQRFVIGWFFPNHRENGGGPLVGHQYEAWTHSPADSVRLLADQFESLRAASAKWCDTLGDSSWPQWVNDWLVNNQYTLAKFTWWTRDGRFMSYESPECPNGSPVHILDLADWPVIDSFPEMELRLLRQFADTQQKSGRIAEQFNYNGGEPGISTPGGRDLLDINPKFVVEIYHRWRETGDKAFLDATWPAAKKAILYSKRFDSLHVGLPSGPKLSSTWDHWNNRYLPSYGASVWLAGLRAAEELAKVEGDPAFASQARQWYETGLATMNERLWNGEFYAMTTDRDLKQDNLSFVEATYGDVFGRLVGLGSILPDDKSLSSLRAIARYNNQPTRYGLVVTADTTGAMVKYNGDERAQITVCHAIPAPIGLIQEGNQQDIDNGLRILRQMYDLGQKHPGGLWNLPHHVVAATGERNVRDFPHYLRDRSLWALMKVLNGWSYDAPNQSLEIGPILNPEDCHGPWSCFSGYGQLRQKISAGEQAVVLATRDGTIQFKRLILRSRIGVIRAVDIERDGKPVSPTFTQDRDQVVIAFPQPQQLGSGNTLHIELKK